MHISIKKLGIVENAEIDINNPLTILCGPNGTGKTYVSYILYALSAMDQYNGKYYRAIVDEITKQGTITLKKEYLDDWLYCKSMKLKNNLDFVFGISKETSQIKFKNFDCNITIDDNDFNEIIGVSFLYPNGLAKSSGSNIINFGRIPNPNNLANDIDTLFNLLCNLHNRFMLPVERNSIYTFKTELSLNRNNLIDMLNAINNKEDMATVLNKQSRRYPFAINQNLMIANDLENVRKRESPYYDLAKEIEKFLLHGSVDISDNGDVEFAVDKNNKLPFQMSSSMVKTLSSLTIFLKHLAVRGSTLIIDEPEMNLHPDSQRILAQIFAMLVNTGIKLVISTHSDYIIREINNLIMANGVKAENEENYLKEIGYTKMMLLDNKKVATYFFKHKSAKSVVVESLKVDKTGFAVPSIDDTINRQNELADKLYYDLKYGGDSNEDDN